MSTKKTTYKSANTEKMGKNGYKSTKKNDICMHIKSQYRVK